MNKPLNPILLIVVFTFLAAVLFIQFWSTGEEAKSRIGSFYLEHNQRGGLSIQFDSTILQLDKQFNVVDSFDLSNLGLSDVMGNLVYFDNGDFLIRMGKPEAGLKSYFSLFQLFDTENSEIIDEDLKSSLENYEKKRDEWVSDLSIQSNLSRCSFATKKCSSFYDQEVAWRYRLMIDDMNQKVFLTEGTKHKVSVLNFEGEKLSELKIDTIFPKRVRKFDSKYSVIDTNNNRVINLEPFDTTNNITYHNVKVDQHGAFKWPIDAIYFDGHWWVVNAGSNMQNSKLMIFNKEWSFVKLLVLPEQSEPFDLIVFDGKLLLSDLWLGQFYVFESLNSKPKVLKFAQLENYINVLAVKRDNVKTIRHVALIVFLLLMAMVVVFNIKK